MAKYQLLFLYVLLHYSGIESVFSQKLISDCQPRDPLVKILLPNEKKRTDYPGLLVQINWIEDTGNLKAEGNWEVNIDRNPYCATPTPEISTKESPVPFYELFPGMGYYKLHTNQKDWNSAKLICEKEGAHLAIINSQEEVKILQELRRRLPKIMGSVLDEHLIVGITDVEKEGEWRTIFNQLLNATGFSDFGSGEPNGGTKENCGDLYAPLGKFNDAPCTLELPFVCEKEL